MPTGTNKLPNEIGMLCGAISPGDFFIVKGIIQTLLEDLGINSYKFQTHEEKDSFPYTLFSRTEKSDLKIENTPLGILGKVGQKTLTDFGIERETYLFNLNLDALIKFVTSFRRYIPISKNPPVIEDLAFIIPTQTLLGDLIQTIKSVDPLISKVSLIDTFEGTKTFRIFYQDPQKTLSGQQVEKIRQKIIQKVERTSGAKLKTKQ